MDGRTDGSMDGRMDGWIYSAFVSWLSDGSPATDTIYNITHNTTEKSSDNKKNNNAKKSSLAST
eukprot:scaffold197273_cov14-Prasinocladus_malaysianus.AAC.1